jgi:hypothetical protein
MKDFDTFCKELSGTSSIGEIQEVSERFSNEIDATMKSNNDNFEREMAKMDAEDELCDVLQERITDAFDDGDFDLANQLSEEKFKIMFRK